MKYVINVAYFCFMALNELPAQAEKIKQVFEVWHYNDQKWSMKVS